MKSLPTALPWIAIAISLMSVFYTARTFAIPPRPYVGIVEHSFELVGQPPEGMIWRFAIKNTGSTPTWATIEDNTTITLADGTRRTLPMFGEPRGGVYLMPGQSADLPGQFSNAGGNARVEDVIAGRTQLDVNIRVIYSSPGAFGLENAYFYSAVNRFRMNPQPPRFVMAPGMENERMVPK